MIRSPSKVWYEYGRDLIIIRLQYVSIIAYSNKALSQNEFNGLTFTCGPESVQCITTGEQVLEIYALKSPWLWHCVIINLMISIVFAILGYVFFAYTSAPMMRLTTITPAEKKESESITMETTPTNAPTMKEVLFTV